MHEISGSSGTGHGRGDFTRDMSRFTHTADDDPPFTAQYQIQRMQKAVVEAQT
jgi:hypothetical protein